MLRILKRGVKRVVRSLGYEIVRPESYQELSFAHHLRRLFSLFNVQCVLDVGANRGQYGQFLRSVVGFEGWIISFEPVHANARVLAPLTQHDPRWEVCAFALGAESRNREINVMRTDLFDSFLEPDGSLVADFDTQNVIDHTEVVEVKRLDSTLPGLRAEYPMENAYLKIDTQGFDLEVIEGAGRELSTFCALQTELSIRRIYKHAPTYVETLRELGLRGFDISGMFPVVSDSAMRAIELDCVMVNATKLEGNASRGGEGRGRS